VSLPLSYEEQTALEAKLFNLQERLHTRPEGNGRSASKSGTWVAKIRAEMLSILERLGYDGASSSAALSVLVGEEGRFPVKTDSMDAALEAADAPHDDAESASPSARLLDRLSTPGPEETVVGDGPALLSPEASAHTDHAREDAAKDRRENFLHALWQDQAKLVARGELEQEIDNFTTFAQVVALRALLLGYLRYRNTANHRSFDKLLEAAFPVAKNRKPRAEAVRALVQDHDILSDPGAAKRLLPKTVSPLEVTAEEALLAAAYHQVPQLSGVVGAMVEAYSDLVRASRPAAETDAKNDLPDVHRPRVGEEGFKPYASRIAHVYKIVGNADHTARAFGVDHTKMSPYLKKHGLMNGSRSRHRY